MGMMARERECKGSSHRRANKRELWYGRHHLASTRFVSPIVMVLQAWKNGKRRWWPIRMNKGFCSWWRDRAIVFSYPKSFPLFCSSVRGKWAGILISNLVESPFLLTSCCAYCSELFLLVGSSLSVVLSLRISSIPYAKYSMTSQCVNGEEYWKASSPWRIVPVLVHY
jgi:hypothetical protein